MQNLLSLPRFIRLFCRLVLCGSLIMGIAIVPFCGCQSLLFTAAYLIKGPEHDPECKLLLKGKKTVVVVSKATSLNQVDCETAPKDLSQQLTMLILTNAKNKELKMVDQRRVESWLDDCDNHCDDLAEAGEKLKADYTIGVEIHHFSLRENANLYQGRAVLVVTLHETATGHPVYKKSLPEIVYPPNSYISSREKSFAEFQREFVSIVAHQVGALFYKHDPNKLRRLDADAL